MNKFLNMTASREISDAVKLAELQLLPYTSLYDSVSRKNDWRFDNIKSGSETAWSLCITERKPVPVFTYKPLNPFTKAIGFFDGKAIHINARKLPFVTTVEIAANLLHEYAHFCGYTHGTGPTANFKTQEKCLYSVPYFLSSNMEKWI